MSGYLVLALWILCAPRAFLVLYRFLLEDVAINEPPEPADIGFSAFLAALFAAMAGPLLLAGLVVWRLALPPLEAIARREAARKERT